MIVSLGIDRADLIDAHWSYFYDRDVFFTRLSTPHLQSPNNVPPGCGSLQAECYYSKKYRPLDRRPEDCIEPVIADLKRCGVLRETDRILFRHAMHIPYANVIFDLEFDASYGGGSRLPGRHRHRILRPLWRLGLHLDRPILCQRRECAAKVLAKRRR